MKIILPNGQKLTLEQNVSIERKLELVEELLVEWEDVILATRNDLKNNPFGYFLDGLANYLVWHKEEEDRNTEDKDILSVKKIEQMTGKRKSKTIPFSSLSTSGKEILGLSEGETND